MNKANANALTARYVMRWEEVNRQDYPKLAADEFIYFVRPDGQVLVREGENEEWQVWDPAHNEDCKDRMLAKLPGNLTLVPDGQNFKATFVTNGATYEKIADSRAFALSLAMLEAACQLDYYLKSNDLILHTNYIGGPLAGSEINPVWWAGRFWRIVEGHLYSRRSWQYNYGQAAGAAASQSAIYHLGACEIDSNTARTISIPVSVFGSEIHPAPPINAEEIPKFIALKEAIKSTHQANISLCKVSRRGAVSCNISQAFHRTTHDAEIDRYFRFCQNLAVDEEHSDDAPIMGV